MSDYISRERAIKHLQYICKILTARGNKTAADILERYAIKKISDKNSVPAADVAEVVRCRDCRHRYPKDFEMRCPYHQGPVAPMDYCSSGERKENEDG